MTTTDPNSFHDPDLKASLCRVWGTEAAPAALGERVAARGTAAATDRAAAIPSVAPLTHRPAWTWPLRHPRPLYGLAASLMMVIGFAVAYQLDQPPAWRSASGAFVVSNPTGP